MPETAVSQGELPLVAESADAGALLSATRQSVTDVMGLADLQTRLMAMDMETVTDEDIERLFAHHADNPAAEGLKKNLLAIRKLRQAHSDAELLEKFYPFRPMGPCGITVTPVAFEVVFYNPVDWLRFSRLNKNPGWIADTIVCRGRSSGIDFREGENIFKVNVNTYRGWGLATRQSTQYHEDKHARNRSIGVGAAHRESFAFDSGLDHEGKIRQVIDFIVRFNLNHLKDELSAYIASGTSRQRLLLWIFRSRYTLGLYEFHDMPKDFFDFCRDRGFSSDDIAHVKRELKKKINIAEIAERSYHAVQLLESKGYSRAWAVDYLCAGEHFLADWLSIAEACPARLDSAS